MVNKIFIVNSLRMSTKTMDGIIDANIPTYIKELKSQQI